MTKGPGEDGFGGATFRPGWQATPPNRPKPAGVDSSRRGPVFGYGSRAIRVIGGVAETQWLTTLTGEVPRRPRAAAEPDGSIRHGEVTPLDKSLTKRAADAAER